MYLCSAESSLAGKIYRKLNNKKNKTESVLKLPPFLFFAYRLINYKCVSRISP